MGSLSVLTEHDVTITSFTVTDLRFPTSLDGVGSDAMHVGTNGSHPFIQLQTNRDRLIGEGIVGTITLSPPGKLLIHSRPLAMAGAAN